MVNSTECYGIYRSFYKPLLQSLNVVVQTGLFVFARTNGCGFAASTATTRPSSDGATSRKQGTDVHVKVDAISPFVCHLKWSIIRCHQNRLRKSLPCSRMELVPAPCCDETMEKCNHPHILDRVQAENQYVSYVT